MRHTKIKEFKSQKEVNDFLKTTFDVEWTEYIKYDYRDLKIIQETTNSLKSFVLVYSENLISDVRREIAEMKKWEKEFEKDNT